MIKKEKYRVLFGCPKDQVEPIDIDIINHFKKVLKFKNDISGKRTTGINYFNMGDKAKKIKVIYQVDPDSIVDVYVNDKKIYINPMTYNGYDFEYIEFYVLPSYTYRLEGCKILAMDEEDILI